MTQAVAYVDAALGIARRDLAVFASYRMRLVTTQFGILFNLALFYYISRLIQVGPGMGPDAYYAFVVIGLIILSTVRSSLAMPDRVRSELVTGTFERIVLSPFGATAAALSMLLFPFVYAIVVGAITLLVAVVVFSVAVQWDTVALAIPLGFLGSLAFAPFAAIFTAITLVFKQAPGQAMVISLISLASGLYFPVALLPDWIGWLSEVQPFTPTVDLMRNVAVGLPLEDSAWTSLAKLFGFVLILLPASVWVLAQAGRLSRRRGTITEY